MDNGGMPSDWKPPTPPEVGCWEWKRDCAVSWAIQNGELRSEGVLSQRIVRCPIITVKGEQYDLGYLAIARRSGGYDYIWGEDISPALEGE